MNESQRAIEILLVEDNPGDVRLTKEALKDSKIRNNLQVSGDGTEALQRLWTAKDAGTMLPDVVLLDLDLPGRGGHDVLAEIKTDDILKRIPVVIVSSSGQDSDILGSYDRHANCYLTKPLALDQFSTMVQSIEDFWFTIVKLPTRTTLS